MPNLAPTTPAELTPYPALLNLVPAARAPISPARQKLESLIAQGRRQAQATVARVFHEIPVDFLIKPSALTFALNDARRPALLVPSADGPALFPAAPSRLRTGR